ncbi:MAG: hypothetical protein P4L85_18495 [Paludisphaera borealis]|uniref:hypothetical protein n=1 Tax=Paludisphaera borealis TaxID=1387353 RepID=UPI0028401A63|nr:hypothetical protein [Paludisphaera borealis]MDR3621347.1 hypothetical protein [Paludisphaera borealis]
MGLFGRAKNLFKGMGTFPEPKVQYYNVVCPLGHRVRGQRTEGYQALRCPACGEGVFVLPLSPLPEPIAPARSAMRRARVEPSGVVVDEGPVELHDPGEVTVEMERDDRQADAEIIWEDDQADGAEDLAAKAPQPDVDKIARDRRRSAAKRAPAQPEAAAATRGGRKPDRRVALDEPEIEERRPRRRPSRPLVVFSVVALLVVGTVALRTWRSRRQQYPLVAELGRVEGIPALERGDFDTAYQLLSAAKHAVDSLGGGVEGADKIRQAADEAGVFNSLLPETLEDLLDQAARTNPQAWASRFEDQYQGRAVILDTKIKATPDSAEKRYEVEYLVMPLGEAANFRGAGGARPERTARIDLDDFELFQLAEPKVGDHVVFGARLAQFQFDAAGGSWVVRFQPKSGVFIQHNKALETLGWPSAADVVAEPGGP